jgi:hypothetical protein
VDSRERVSVSETTAPQVLAGFQDSKVGSACSMICVLVPAQQAGRLAKVTSACHEKPFAPVEIRQVGDEVCFVFFWKTTPGGHTLYFASPGHVMCISSWHIDPTRDHAAPGHWQQECPGTAKVSAINYFRHLTTSYSGSFLAH